MGEVFISYKQEERERMRPIADGLRALGVEVWFDERLQPDRSFTEEIQHLIGSCRAQLVCWSPAAVASEWVRGEAEKGRQRGVLVAAMIEPCDLPPPFNMHHAESLVGWSGDPRHNGWRKIVDALGRKLDRPGLGELAALQGSNDPAAWKKWAQRHATDPQADAAWARAEELEIGAARERMARERDVAKRAAEEAEHRKAWQAAQPAPAAPVASARAAPASVKERRKSNGWLGWGLGVAAVGLAAAAGVFVFQQMQRDGAAFTLGAPGAARAALDVIDRLSEQDWNVITARGLVARVIDESSLESLVAAAETDSRAQVLMANAYYYAIGGVEKNDTLALAYAQRSASADDPRGQNTLAFFYWAGRGVERNFDEMLRLYRLSAAQGYAPAEANLGLAYATGIGVERNYREAARYYRLAAEKGNPQGQAGLAALYVDGQGVPRDNAEALRLYGLSAEQGHAAAQCGLGVLFSRGQAVVQDSAEAVRWFRMAADQGSSCGQFNMGVSYVNGAGVPRDYAEAMRWYRLAADQNSAAAQVALAAMYEDGLGAPANIAEAVRLYRLAARQGNERAQANLRRLGETW